MQRMTLDELRTFQQKQSKPGKYRSQKTLMDGITFHSKREANEYYRLKLREAKGEIFDLKLQPRFPIIIKGRKVCTVVLDFSFYDIEQQRTRHIDVKGWDNDLSKLKRKMVEAEYGITVEIVK